MIFCYLTFVVDVEIDVVTCVLRNDNSKCCDIFDVCQADRDESACK